MTAQSVRSTYPDDDARWAAAQRRDPGAAHEFYICVKTTGVYCLSTCAARPLRKNVFFATSRAEAEAAGMRACKRCKPDAAPVAQPSADRVRAASRRKPGV